MASAALAASSTDASSGPKWSEIDKWKFYGIGTGLYSALTVLLHPVTVVKTRQQVLNGAGAPSAAGAQHQPTALSVVRGALAGPPSSCESASAVARRLDRIRGLYRGLGTVLTVAIPARALYIGVLESAREGIGATLSVKLVQAEFGPEESHSMLPLVATVSGGAAGGVAALSAQCLVVPMDVVSQRQMAMGPSEHAERGTARDVVRDVIRSEGPKGLYRGFGLSVLSSLPAGTVWWGVYGGCQHALAPYRPRTEDGAAGVAGSVDRLARRGAVQLVSGLSAALVASVVTQPLDVVKTRLQVGSTGASPSPSSSSPNVEKGGTAGAATVARELWAASGVRGFFRGTGPRIVHMGLWGTVLSSAYEFLREVSKKR